MNVDAKDCCKQSCAKYGSSIEYIEALFPETPVLMIGFEAQRKALSNAIDLSRDMCDHYADAAHNYLRLRSDKHMKNCIEFADSMWWEPSFFETIYNESSIEALLESNNPSN